jgi:two-component system, OmpR family, sensor histidine kinase KdpD
MVLTPGEENRHETSAATLDRNEHRGDAEALLLARPAAQATEADREQAALLAAVSHDLRAPLAAAKAAVGGLRLHGDLLLTAENREELLSAAEESLDLLAHLTASLLDVSRRQAGAQAVFPGPPIWAG